VAEFRLSRLRERFADFFPHGLEVAENKNSMMVHAELTILVLVLCPPEITG